MPIVTLRPGESIRVEFYQTDGGFDIAYGENELTVHSDLPGSHCGSSGLVHREVYGQEEDEVMLATPPEQAPKAKPYIGEISCWSIVWHDPHGYVVCGQTHGDRPIRTSPIVKLEAREVGGFYVETENSRYTLVDAPDDAAGRNLYKAMHGREPVTGSAKHRNL